MDTYTRLAGLLHQLFLHFQKMPGSAIVLRYVRSSYQNDPVRSAVELFLFLFFIRYLLAPKYSTQNKGYVALSDDVTCHCPKFFLFLAAWRILATPLQYCKKGFLDGGGLVCFCALGCDVLLI
jgi:hypothetical protein